MALVRRLRAWWNRDAVDRAEEETSMTAIERDVAEEDYEARKDDVVARDGLLGGGATDFEADSERPRRQDSS
jgi:hypothetical protein